MDLNMSSHSGAKYMGRYSAFLGQSGLLLSIYLAARLFTCIYLLKRSDMHPISCELALWGRTCAEYETANGISGWLG